MDRATYTAFLVINNKLNRILKILGDEVIPELEALEAQVARVEQASQAIATKLAQLVQGGTVDPARVQALVDRLTTVAENLESATASAP